MKSLMLITLCLALAPAAAAVGQTHDIDAATVLSWDLAAGAPSELAETLAAGDPQTISTSWTDHDGLDHTVTTARRNGEDVEDWALRHQEAVDGLQAIFPIEAPPEEERQGQGG